MDTNKLNLLIKEAEMTNRSLRQQLDRQVELVSEMKAVLDAHLMAIIKGKESR
jgi:hypothetical protein